MGSATQTRTASTTLPLADSPLGRTVATTATDIWNDSCSVEELTYAVAHGAVGATSNPTIVHNVLQKEMHLWDERIRCLIRENPTWDEVEITWKLIEEMARVCKPEGQVVIINHFSSPRKVIRKVVNLVDPLTRRLGWSTRLSLDDAINGAPLSLKSRYKTSPWSLFTVVEARKHESYTPRGATH